jgi:hypothetical protein
MKTIVSKMPNKDPAIIKFVQYFAKQWLNGNQSPEIWNHHQTIGRRTNNGLEGHHFKIASVTPNNHPRLQVQVELFKRENALATDKYAKSMARVLDLQKDPKKEQWDRDNFLIHEEIINCLELMKLFKSKS